MTIDELISQGEKLADTDIESTGFEMWLDDVREFVAPYGERKLQLLEQAGRISSVIIDDYHESNRERFSKVVEFLESLRSRSVEQSRVQDQVINQKQAEAQATLKTKFNNVHVHGDATFGDNSPLTKVTVGEFMASLVKEVETLPESEERNKILEGLKTALANPTFAAVAGTGVGEVLKKLMGA